MEKKQKCYTLVGLINGELLVMICFSFNFIYFSHTKFIIGKIYSTKLRSIISFGKLTPINANEKNVQKHYSKNRRFSKAMDEMKVLQEISRSNSNVAEKNDVGRKPAVSVPPKSMDSINQANIRLRTTKLRVLLHRFTSDEIASYCTSRAKNQKR